MGVLPETPHFAFVDFKIGNLVLSPIPPQHIQSFTYTRTTKTGEANKFSLTVYDDTAVVIEYALTNNTSMSGNNGMSSVAGDINIQTSTDGNNVIYSTNGQASELSAGGVGTTTVDIENASDPTDNNPDSRLLRGESSNNSLGQSANSDCEFSYGYVNGIRSDIYKCKITQFTTEFTSQGVTITLEGTSMGLAESMMDPDSITYKQMLVSDIVKAEADRNGWYYNDSTIEETEPVLESVSYQITRNDIVAGANNSLSSGQTAGPVTGQTINIPEGLGTTTTYTTYSENGFGNGAPSAGTMQRTVWETWKAAGCTYDSQGLAMLDGYYLIATTSTFGKVGDIVQFTLSNGQTIKGIIADEKNQNDSGATQWGHDGGKSMIEFEVNPSYAKGQPWGGPGHPGWHEEWANTTTTSAVNGGRYSKFN